MSLYGDTVNLMHDSVTVYRFVNVSQQGDDSFDPTTEVISPVRITRNVETVYESGGRAVQTRGKIIMLVPSLGPLKEKDKLVSGEGEVFRVYRASRKKDKDANEYQVVIVT
jgi:hypothetical protein